MQILLILGMVSMGLILIYMFKLPVSAETIQNPTDTEKISDKKLFTYILPNNKGRSIDEVVAALKEKEIEPEFHIKK